MQKDMRQMTDQGRRIESDSFAIIDQEAGPHAFTPDQWQVVRRVIHATGDFEFKELMAFHPLAVETGVNALRRGAPLLVDVKMIEAGLNAARLKAFGVSVHCFISDEDVIAQAQARGSTRAVEAMAKAQRLGLLDGAIVAVGNAPTALLEAARLVRHNHAAPALVVGVPVGFVSAAESKQGIMELDVPHLVARGRKGGSAIAVAVLHALMALAAQTDPVP